MSAYRFLIIKNVEARMLFNFQKRFTRLLPMMLRWCFDKQ